MHLLDLIDRSYDVLITILVYLDTQDLARLSVTTSSLLEVCRNQMVRQADSLWKCDSPLPKLASFCRFMLASNPRLSLLQSLRLDLTACHVEVDDLGELGGLEGLEAREALSGSEVLETLLAPLLQSAVNLKSLGVSEITHLQLYPILTNALATSFARAEVLLLTGRSVIQLSGHVLQLERRAPLRWLSLEIVEEEWLGIWGLLEPCRDTLETLLLTNISNHSIPPMESCNPWPRMSHLRIHSISVPDSPIFTSQNLPVVFPNLRRLEIPYRAVRQVNSSRDEMEWRSLHSFAGTAVTWVSLGLMCQLSELALDFDKPASVGAGTPPHTAPYLTAALTQARPRCLTLGMLDACKPGSDELQRELCKASLWEISPMLEYVELTIYEGPCCTRLIEFLARFCESLQATRLSYLSLAVSSCRSKPWSDTWLGREENTVSTTELLRDVTTCVQNVLSTGPTSLKYLEISVWDRIVNSKVRRLYRVWRPARVTGLGEIFDDAQVLAEFLGIDMAVASVVKRSLGRWLF